MKNETEPSSGSLTRRALLRAASVAAMGGLGAAMWPRVPRSRVAIPSGRTVVDYWEKWTGPEGDAIQRVVDGFNESQSRIWVRRTAISEIDTKAMVAIGGGDPPDVCGVFSYNIAQYAQSDAAIPLSEFGDAQTRINPAIYAPAVRELLSFRGKHIAGVTSLYSLALYYNRAMFREVGLDPEKPPRTIGELDTASAKLTMRNGSGAIVRAGLLQNLPTWWPYSWPVMFGGTLYDAGVNKATFDSAETLRAYEWVQATARKLGVAETESLARAYDRSFHSPRDPFISGRVAMIVQGPWIANFANRYNPGLEYAAGPLPVGEGIYREKEPVGLLEADVLVIPRGAKQPEAAFEFVRYTQTQRVQEQLAREHTKSSPLAECSAGFFEGHPNKYVRVHDAITKSPRVQILPQTSVWKSYAHLTEGAFDAAWKGADVREVCAGVQARVQGMMDRDGALRKQRETSSVAYYIA